MREILAEQKQQIDHFFHAIDLERAELFLRECARCTGLMVFTGVGKSGIIAEKIATTLVSTGTRAIYLPPTNFLHGDLGIVSERDLFITLSKSGETDELLSLIPFVRRRKARLLAVVSNPLSRLAKEADLSIALPVLRELCPFDLAPTTSTAVQLLFGDLLAVFLMKAKNFSIEQYALNHPSGSIGKKMTLLVDDLMLKGEEIPLCRGEDRLRDLFVELSNKRCGCLLVVDETRRLRGIFTDGDLRRALQRRGAGILEESLDHLMTSAPLFVWKGLLAYEALKIMQKDPKRWIQALPVLEGEHRVVGILRMHDIIHAGLSA